MASFSFGRPLSSIARALFAGVVVFVLLSIFASDPSPDEVSYSAERSCRNDWRRCASDKEMLDNWKYELELGKPSVPGALTPSAKPRQ